MSERLTRGDYSLYQQMSTNDHLFSYSTAGRGRQFRHTLYALVVMSMGVDAYQTYQTSRTTFSAALSAAPATILARDTALSLGQVSTK